MLLEFTGFHNCVIVKNHRTSWTTGIGRHGKHSCQCLMQFIFDLFGTYRRHYSMQASYLIFIIHSKISTGYYVKSPQVTFVRNFQNMDIDLILYFFGRYFRILVKSNLLTYDEIGWTQTSVLVLNTYDMRSR